MNTRVVIEQAKGALARVHGISVDEAFERMRRYTRGHNRKLSEVAYAVLSDLTSVAGLTRT